MLTRPGSPAPRVIDRHVPEHRSLIHRHREIPVGPGKKGCSLRHSCDKIPQDVPCACTVELKPCNCRNLVHYSGRCRCTPDQIARYRSKISGPLLDRIEIRIEVPAVPPEELQRAAQGDQARRSARSDIHDCLSADWLPDQGKSENSWLVRVCGSCRVTGSLHN